VDRTDVLIIGGGISGLSLAWQLSQRGIKTQLWESAKRLGGKIKSDHHDGYITEQSASVVLNYRPEVSRFLAESGLAKIMEPRNRETAPNRYVLNNGSLIKLSSSLHQVLMSPLWSKAGRLRLLAECMISRGGGADETVSQFIRRRFGDELLDKAIEPFVAGILASDPDKANAWSVLPRMTALERRFGRVSVGVLAHKLLHRRTASVREIFSFKGGMSSLVDGISDRLATSDTFTLRTDCCAQQLVQSGNGWLVSGETAAGDQSVQTRQVVLCTPAAVSSNLLKPLDARLSKLLAGIEYAAMSLVHLGFDRSDISHPLDGTGFLTPRAADLSFTGNLWLSSTFSKRAPPDKALMTCYMGGSRNPHVAGWDNQRMIDTALSDLGGVLGIRAAPEMTRIVRHRQALPLYHGAYFQRCQAISEQVTAHPGLHLLANYLDGVSVRDRLANSLDTACMITEALKIQKCTKQVTGGIGIAQQI